ncbi:hypothetical protein ACHAXT_004300 [Thalassiosira profunda]
MILIWSGDGGPLQLAGMALFALQFLAPNLLRFTIDLHDGTVEFGSFPPLLWVACSLVVAAFMGGLWVFWDWQRQMEGGPAVAAGNEGAAGTAAPSANNDGAPAPQNAAGEAAAPAPDGSAANPVVIDLTGEQDGDFWTRTLTRFQSLSHTHVMLAMGFVLPMAMTAPLLLNGLLQDSGVVQVTLLAIVAHSLMAVAAYRVLRDVLNAGGAGQYPGNRRGIGRRRPRKLTVAEIADIVRKVPVEEYVSQEDIQNGECSVARMKRMLVNRGAAEAAENCVEREELVQEVERVRKFNEECAICAEEYAEGEVLRVTHCQHEFHLHCFDKWLYTFTTDSRHATHPTCPLCKAVIS